MIRLLSLGNPLPAVISSLSEEFGCSKDTVQRDHQNMDCWGKPFLQNPQKRYVLNERLEFLSRTLMETVLNSSKPLEKARAVEVALKITREQAKFGKEYASIEAENQLSAIQNVPVEMPFMCDPLIKEAWIREEKKQREEYEARKVASAAHQKKQAEDQNAEFELK